MKLKDKVIKMGCAKGDQLELLMGFVPKSHVVAYIGKKRPKSRRGEILVYTGGGKWVIAEIKDLAKEESWTLIRDADAGLEATSDKIMFGTFNGRVDSLWEMMTDSILKPSPSRVRQKDLTVNSLVWVRSRIPFLP